MRHVAGDEFDPPPIVRVGQGYGVEQGPGVGMAGRGEQVVRRCRLDDAAEVHHGHPVGDVLDDAEVVGDDEVGEVELALQPLEQVDDLRLDGDVEGHSARRR